MLLNLVFWRQTHWEWKSGFFFCPELLLCCNPWILGVFPPDYVQHGPGPRYSYEWWKHCKIPTNKMQHQNESVPIVKHQSRSGKKGRKLSGIFQSRVNSMGNLSLAINFSHCCSKDWVKAQKAISFYLFNLFPFFWHALIPLIQQFFLRFFWVCDTVHWKISM